VVRSFDRLHPRVTHRGAWADHDGEVPIIEGTVIRSKVDRLPGDGEPKPLWLWFSGTGVEAADVDRLWQAFLRRFDLEHTSGFSSKPSVGRDPACAHGGGRSVDLADHRRAHPTPVGAAPRRGPPPPLGETPPTTRRRMTPARVLQGVSQHPADNGSARRRTETLTARSRPPSRITKHPARRTTQPRQNP
jgi:hypothetical protein